MEHELMHQETLMYMYMQLDVQYKQLPHDIKFDLTSRKLTEPRQISIPTGSVRLGADFDTIPFGWDNEFPAFITDVPAFQIDRYPVTNGEFYEFVSSGAYNDPSHWLDEDWKWKEKFNVKHPMSWSLRDGQVSIRTLFGIDIPLVFASSWPVFVTWAEACAYGQWKGGRLPSEAEWCQAAYGSPAGDDGRLYPWGNEQPATEHGNFNWQSLSPTPVGSHPKGSSAWGVEDLIGDGWEWTGTPFDGYDGFKVMCQFGHKHKRELIICGSGMNTCQIITCS
jgi:formylglycine-generating enzyme required for sulfatase activity